MNLIVIFALLAIVARTLFICACQRSNRRETVRAEAPGAVPRNSHPGGSRAPRQMPLLHTRGRLLYVALLFAGCLVTQWPPSERYLADVTEAGVAALSWQKAKY